MLPLGLISIPAVEYRKELALMQRLEKRNTASLFKIHMIFNKRQGTFKATSQN